VTVQWILVALVAAAAAAYLGRQAWRTWTATGCGKSCGCSGPRSEKPGLVAADDLLTRVRQRREGGR
jgi:hypothetical protein